MLKAASCCRPTSSDRPIDHTEITWLCTFAGGAEIPNKHPRRTPNDGLFSLPLSEHHCRLLSTSLPARRMSRGRERVAVAIAQHARQKIALGIARQTWIDTNHQHCSFSSYTPSTSHGSVKHPVRRGKLSSKRPLSTFMLVSQRVYGGPSVCCKEHFMGMSHFVVAMIISIEFDDSLMTPSQYMICRI